jgi:hypothetical protein
MSSCSFELEGGHYLELGALDAESTQGRELCPWLLQAFSGTAARCERQESI